MHHMVDILKRDFRINAQKIRKEENEKVKCFKIIVNTQHAFGVKFPFDQWWWKIQIFMINNYKDFTEAYNIAIVNCRFI